jgi:hypothetical protein
LADIGRGNLLGYINFEPMKRRKPSKTGGNASAAWPSKGSADDGPRADGSPARLGGGVSHGAMTLTAAIVILAAGMLSYADSFSGPFLFDGINNVENNLAFRT